jgi:hypothetical protein
MICLLEDRRSFCNALENLSMMLKHYSIRAEPIKQPLLNNFFIKKEQRWKPDRIDLALEFIEHRSFFKRFTRQ